MKCQFKKQEVYSFNIDTEKALNGGCPSYVNISIYPDEQIFKAETNTDAMYSNEFNTKDGRQSFLELMASISSLQ